MELSRLSILVAVMIFWFFGVSWASCRGVGLENPRDARSVREGSARGSSSCASGGGRGSSYRSSSYGSRRSGFGGGGFSFGK